MTDPVESAIRGRPSHDCSDVRALWDWHVADAAEFGRPVDRAIFGAAAADRLAGAFAVGYAAALHAMVPGLWPRVVSLAATEQGGAHPRAIRTELERVEDGLRLTGRKRWVTWGGGDLLVLASAGLGADGRARLHLVRVSGDRPGITRVALAEVPFVPEMPHFEVGFDRVPVSADDVLPGDGWQDWVKPFRTVEDIFVHASALAYLLSTGARWSWPQPSRERLAGVLVAFRALAASDPSAAATHVALGGAIALSTEVVRECEPHWARVEPGERARWERDRVLLDVAAKARGQRLQRAWARL